VVVEKFDPERFQLNVGGEVTPGWTEVDPSAWEDQCEACGAKSVFFEASLPLALLEVAQEGRVRDLVMDVLTDMLADQAKVPCSEASVRTVAEKLNERFKIEGVWAMVPWRIQLCPECGVVFHKRIEELYD